MNKVILIGRLTKDPDLRYTQSGMAVCQFTLAVNKNLSKDKKEEMEAQNKPTADFPRIVVWGKMGENASRYLKKGSQCAVEGQFRRVLMKIIMAIGFTLQILLLNRSNFLPEQRRTIRIIILIRILAKIIKIVLRAITEQITKISLMMILKMCKMIIESRFNELLNTIIYVKSN